MSLPTSRIEKVEVFPGHHRDMEVVEYLGLEWIRPVGTHEMFSPHPRIDQDRYGLMATSGMKVHEPRLALFDKKRIEEISRFSKTARRAPFLVKAGRGAHLAPRCGIQFWSPWWNLEKLRVIRELQGLHDNLFVPCTNCFHYDSSLYQMLKVPFPDSPEL